MGLPPHRMDAKHKYDPQIHHRKSIRLRDYDYSQAGAYYITICVKDKVFLFGNVVDDEMILNNAGIMIDKWWQKIPEKFPDIELDEYQIMPNHFHAIIINVGADPRVSPTLHRESNMDGVSGEHVDADLGEHKGSPLQDIVRWFKTMSTNEYIRNVKKNNWEPFNGKLFQRNYFEHIIRSEDAYNNIVAYIRNNPMHWNNDKFYSK